MKLPWLKTALETDGPFITVHLDTTRTDPQSAAALATRWAQMRSGLADDGAPDDLLEQIEETVLSPSPIGGRHGRTIVATDTEILVDRVLPVPPEQESAQRGDAPVLLPLLQLTRFAVSQLLILVDRSGADLHLRAPENPSIRQSPNGLGEDSTVEGGHDVVHKANLGGGSPPGWGANNYEARVEDSWERNADAVAEKVDAIVRERLPDMVLLSGDVRAQGLLKAALGQEAQERLVEIPGGTRSVALESESFRAEVAEATEEFVRSRQHELIERFRESQGRDGASVGGAAEVAQALDRGQVEELIFVSGQEPSAIEDLFRQALGTDAGIFALGQEEDQDDLPEGIGAMLRWRDDATPSNRVGSMTGDTERQEAVTPERDEPSPHAQEEQSLRT